MQRRPMMAMLRPRIFETPEEAGRARREIERHADDLDWYSPCLLKGLVALLYGMAWAEEHSEGACTVIVPREAINRLARDWQVWERED